MSPKLSFAIPTYNRDACLEVLLNSLVDEASALPASELEVVVIDNASTDATAEVCQRFAVRIPGFRYVRNPSNIGSELNVASCPSVARGDWLWVSGDDDWLLPGILSRVLAEIAANDVDILLLNRAQCHQDGVTMVTEYVAEVAGDITLPRLGQWSRVPASFEMIGFLSSAVFRRQPIVDIDPALYPMGSYWSHAGKIFEAFGDKPMRFLAAPGLVQRLFNIRAGGDEETTLKVELATGVAFLQQILQVEARGRMPADEVWSWSMRRAYGPGGGSIPVVEWVLNCLIKGPLSNSFGRLTTGDYELLRHLVAEEGERLPGQIRRRLYDCLMAALDGTKAYNALLKA